MAVEITSQFQGYCCVGFTGETTLKAKSANCVVTRTEGQASGSFDVVFDRDLFDTTGALFASDDSIAFPVASAWPLAGTTNSCAANLTVVDARTIRVITSVSGDPLEDCQWSLVVYRYPST